MTGNGNGTQESTIPCSSVNNGEVRTRQATPLSPRGTSKCKSLQNWASQTGLPDQSCSLTSRQNDIRRSSFFLPCLTFKLNLCSGSSWFPVAASWGRREDLSPRRRASLSSKGLAVGLGSQSVANDVKIYAWGYRGEKKWSIFCRLFELVTFSKHPQFLEK